MTDGPVREVWQSDSNCPRCERIWSSQFQRFSVSNTDAYAALMLAIAARDRCAATPTALDRFLEFHPTARAFLAAQKTPVRFCHHFLLRCWFVQVINANAKVIMCVISSYLRQANSYSR